MAGCWAGMERPGPASDSLPRRGESQWIRNNESTWRTRGTAALLSYCHERTNKGYNDGRTKGFQSVKPLARIVVFLLASTSIACLLGEMYRLWPMRFFVLAIFLPACGALAAFALRDRWRCDGQVYRVIVIGATAGFIAALSYDIFRLPFVYSTRWGLTGLVPS